MKVFAVGSEPVGVIAIGQVPTGIIAIGQGATGVIAVGQLARGVVAVGQLSMGIFAFGQLALGAAWAGGQVAFGGTTSVAMLGYGPLGRWVPWRRGSMRPRHGEGRSWIVRGVVMIVIAALVAWLALNPVVDAMIGDDGIFRSPPAVGKA